MADLASIQQTLEQHIREDILLRKERLAPDEDLFAAGFDSLSLSRVLVFIEERFGLVIPDEEVVVDQVGTIEKLAHFVAARIKKT